MDHFASKHRMMIHGFLNFQHNQRNANSTQKRFQHNVRRDARSKSSPLNRHEFITTPRFSSISISPQPHHKKEQDMDDVDILSMLMHLLKNNDDNDDPFFPIFLPAIPTSVNKSKMIRHNMQRTTQPFLKSNIGRVLLTLRYHHSENILTVDLIEVDDIVGRQNCDIFLNVQLLQNCRILEKYETCCKRLASKIFFKKTMEFHLPFASFYSSDINLLIKICKDTKKPTEIGHLVIGPQGNFAGMKHWKQIFCNPNTSFSVWHTITPK